jgi:hypothetical protein
VGGAPGQSGDAEWIAVEGARWVFDDLQEGAVGRHLGEDRWRRAALAGAVMEVDRVGRGGEDLDRDEDAGQLAVDLVPARRQRRGPLRLQGTTVGVGGDQRDDHGHRETERNSAAAVAPLHP